MAIRRRGLKLTTREQTAEWVRKALAHADMGQADLTKLMIQAGFLTMDRSVVNKLTLAKRDLKARKCTRLAGLRPILPQMIYLLGLPNRLRRQMGAARHPRQLIVLSMTYLNISMLSARHDVVC
jgi:hypothetical protein